MSLSHMLLSGIFIGGGADAFFKPGYRVNKVENAGIPEPQQAVVLNGAAMMSWGTALAVDIAPKAAAAVLIGTLVPTTIVGHAFLKETDANARKLQPTTLLKKLGLIDGLLLVLFEK